MSQSPQFPKAISRASCALWVILLATTLSIRTASATHMYKPARTALSGGRLVQTADPTLDQGRTEIAFIVDNVTDYQTLVAGVHPGVEVVVLDSHGDGLRQMVDYLAGRRGVDAIHLLSHGTEGQIEFGQLLLNRNNLHQYRHALTAIGQSMTKAGDFMIYGCDIANSEDGIQFLTAIAQITQSDVAASMDATGATQKAGNWTLEANLGQIQTHTVVNLSTQEGFQGLLATPTDGVTTFNDLPGTYTEYARTTNGASGFTATDLAGWDVSAFTSSGSDNFVIASEDWGAGGSDGAFIYVALEGGSQTITSMRFAANDSKLFDLNAIDISYDRNGSGDISFIITGYLDG